MQVGEREEIQQKEQEILYVFKKNNKDLKKYRDLKNALDTLKVDYDLLQEVCLVEIQY